MKSVIRPYELRDKMACLTIFEDNVPLFFAPIERPEFDTFLNAPSCTYFVQEQAGVVVGCGGYYVDEDKRQAGLCWGMVARERHGQGLGRELLLFRLVRLCESGSADVVRLDTSQHSCGFFERMGFVVDKVLLNGFGGGIDRIDMHLILTRDHCRAMRNIVRA